MRILVTGSRDWQDANVVVEAVRDYWEGHGYGGITLIHGACPTGADAAADSLGRIHNVTVVRYHAQWATHGRAAGPIRNQLMVNDGADVCLAFIRRGSRGATMTADLAEKAGIPTIRYTEE